MAKVSIIIEDDTDDESGEPTYTVRLECDPPIPNPANPTIKKKILKSMTTAQSIGYQLFAEFINSAKLGT